MPRNFYSVSLALILVGAGIFALGIVEWIFNYFGSYGFTAPLFKAIGGLLVLGLGYIHLELVLARKNLQNK